MSILAVVGLASPVFAQNVPLPRPRPPAAASVIAPATATGGPVVPLLRPNPGPEVEVPASPPIVADPEVSEPLAPPRDYQVACPAVMTGQVVAKALPPIHEGACGSQSPLSLEAVSANGRMIPMTGPVTTDCGMASALPGWIADVDSFLLATTKTRIESVTIGTSYMCRNVNNGSGGNLSFHSFADALDVVGFTLEDGRNITVDQGWTGSAEQGQAIMHFAHDAACTHFTTVLGPEANALHHDHFHVDLGCHGKTCTARLCE